MTDTKDSDRKGKPLGLRGAGGTETTHVKQSFSHGRTKSVTVEMKRKRVVVPKAGAAQATAANPRGAAAQNLSEAEFDRRLRAVEAAKAQEAERVRKEKEAAVAREAELARLRAEKDAADREERVFRFGAPREALFRFRVPGYVADAVEVFRVDADGVTPVEHTRQAGVVEIRDRASRVAVYVLPRTPGERERLETRRLGLITAENALGFDPGRKAEDLAVLKQMIRTKDE